MKKKPNGYAASLRLLGKRIVKAKKGKGSYSRKKEKKCFSCVFCVDMSATGCMLD